MNKKVLIIVAVVVVLAVLAVGAFFFVQNTPKEINLEEVSAAITEQSNFKEMATMDMTEDLYTSLIGGDASKIEAMVGKYPLMRVQASMYLIVKAKDGAVNDVKQEIETYGQNYEEQWARYLPEQYDLVQNRRVGTYGNYVYIIVEEHAEALEALIK